MAVSFTAEYLYQGAQFFRNNPNSLDPNRIECPEFLLVAGRSVYSLGTLVISPVGALYHTCAAAYRALAQCWATDDTEAKALDTRMWQHLNAAGYDLMGTGLILLNALVVLSIVAAFMIPEPELLGPSLLFLARVYLNDDLFMILPYHFCMHPSAAFSLFLSDEKVDGAQFSQKDEYIAHYIYDVMVRAGLATNAPLTSAEIIELKGMVEDLSVPPDIVTVILAGPSFLKRHNRLAPKAAVQVEALLAKRSELHAALQEARNAALAQPEESRDRFAMEFFGERLIAIQATLPPIGAPAPAQPANEAQQPFSGASFHIDEAPLANPAAEPAAV